jgi:DMSO reductase family type II enzyme heme b subunit
MKKLILLFIPALCFMYLPSVVYGTAGNAENGKKIYEKRCWWCHGAKGEGDGPAAGFLNPPPRSFSDAVFKFKSTNVDTMPRDEDLFRMITNGMPGTSMPAWADMLSETDRWDVIAQIKILGQGMFEEAVAVPIDFSGEVPSSPESIAKGKDIFLKKAGCNECHGDEGRGDGIKAMKDDIFGKRVWPRNLTQQWTFRADSTPRDIYTRVTTGIPGTPMPSFTKGTKTLTNEERWHVANYAASLGDSRKKVTEGEKVIKAVFIEQVPTDLNDPKWDVVDGRVLPLIPQIIADERFFTPTNTTVLVKSVFDKNKIGFLLEWDDRTGSIVGDEAIEKLSEGGELNPDAIGIQLPQTIPTSMQKPYFGHGDKEMGVNMLFWGAGSKEKRDRAAIYDANGVGNKVERPADKSGFTATSQYQKGVWKVLMTRDLKTSEATDLQFEEGKFVPLALANWDGSNLEKGSKHTITTWYWLLMEPAVGNEIYTYPGAVAFILIIAQFFFARSQRKNYS